MVMKRFSPLLCLLVFLVACSTAVTSSPSSSNATPVPTATTAAPTPGASATATPRGVANAGSTPPANAGAAGGTARPSGTPVAAARATATSVRRANTATTLPNVAPAAGAALIEQGVGLLLERYVDPLNTADLYGAAYDGAVETLRASGKTPQARRPAFTGDPRQDADLFRQAYLALAEPAGPDINQTLLAYEALRAVAEQVDECHTTFLDPEQFKQVTAGLEGTQTFGGIGVSIRTQSRPVVVGEIFPGTPAEQGGLRRGDAILAVNGTDVSDLPSDQIAPLVRGQEGTPVTLTIQRPGEPAPRDITLTRARITVPVFTSEVRPGPNGTKIGYMKLYSFSSGAERQVQQALEDFDKQGVNAWVLDLRDNGGGFINTLQQIAGRFIQDGKPVGYRVERDREETIEATRRVYFRNQRPMAVLINGGSASASDAFAAAAQDYGFARLFGQTTAGCLAAAQNFPLSDGSAMGITVYNFVSPTKREINRVGVKPDEEVAPGTNGNEDPVYDAAVRWLATQR
jgi:carboxyl-terminal processing protease